MKFFDERALAGSDGTHEVEDLATLFTLEGGGMEIPDDLRNGLFDTEKLVGKEVKNLKGFVLVKSLDARVVGLLNFSNAGFEDDVVDAGVGELSDGRVFFDFLKIA